MNSVKYYVLPVALGLLTGALGIVLMGYLAAMQSPLLGSTG